MRWYSLFFIIWFAASFAEESELLLTPPSTYELSDLGMAHDLLVRGVVNPLSGQVCLKLRDFTVKGAQDIHLDRTYISPRSPVAFHTDGLGLMTYGCGLATYHAQDISFSTTFPSSYEQSYLICQNESVKHSPDQQALNDLVRRRGNRRFSNEDADTLLDWAAEYDFPARDDRGEEHWMGGEHIHIGNRHVPVEKGD